MMRINTLTLAAASIFFVAAVARAEDEPAATSPPSGVPPDAVSGLHGAEIVHLAPMHKPRWEYGFDLDATRVQGSFTPFVAAQWNYILKPIGTMIGVAAGATPMNVKKTYDGGKSDTSLFTWGVDARQDFYAEGAFSLGASIVAGSGVAYIREHDLGQASEIHGIAIRLFEPGAYVTFISYRSIEVGATGGLRMAIVDDNITQVKTADLTSIVFGLTFRERRAF